MRNEITRELAELACFQAGVVTRQQALGAGLSTGAIVARVRHGRWRQIHRTSESRVDASVNLPPSPVPDPGDDRARGQPGAEGLLPRDHACLKAG